VDAVEVDLAVAAAQQQPDDLRELLALRAAQAPDAPSIVLPAGAHISYGELEGLVAAVAQRLESLGVMPRDRIAVAVPDDASGVVLLLATLSTAVCAPISAVGTEEEFTRALSVLGISAVIAPAQASQLRLAAGSLGIPVLIATAIQVTAAPPRLEWAASSGTLDSPEGRPVPPGIPERLLLRTSGTTAAGKVVPLTMGNILAGATASAAAYQLTAADRRLNCMPLFHVQGLVGSVISSLVAGSSVLCLPAFEPAAVLAALADDGPTWFSGTPAMHRSLLQAGAGARSFGSLRFVRCGSAWLPGELRSAMQDAYGVPVIESYGMTEAHQIASTPLPPGDNRLGMVPTGSRVAVLTADGEVVTTPDRPGELVVSGPNVVRRYLSPAGASQVAFTGDWLRTGDHGWLERDGTIRVGGRLKDLINRGGEKVSPHEVEEVLLRHPAVSDTVVFGIPDPLFTEEVAAAVVPRDGQAVSGRELFAFARARLSSHKLPRHVVVTSGLPTGATGKIRRTGLAQLYAAELSRSWSAGTAEAADGGANDSLEAALAGLWAHLLGVDGIGRDTDFFAAGGNSLLAVSLLTVVSELFGVRISMLQFCDEASTVAEVAAVLRDTWRHNPTEPRPAFPSLDRPA
jgi:acyl-CoA synthetase (AMP-forming)/AMP-acid ligase II